MATSRAPFVAVRTDIRKEERVRFTAEFAGYNEFEAIGRYTSLWCWCTDRGLEDAPDDCDGYAVPEAIVRRFLGARGLEAILGDGCDELAMGERRTDGLIYLRGTSETVSRLRNLRSTAVAGGRAIAVSQGRRPDGRFVRNQQNSQPTDQPASSRPPAANEPPASREPAAASESPDPRSQIPDPESALPRAIPEPAPRPAPTPILPASRERAELKRRLIGRAWTIGGEAFSRVQASGIDPTAPNGWSGMPDASSPPMEDLRAIVDGLLVGERPDAAAAEAKIANRIAVAEAEARAMDPPSARYLTPARIWNRKSFAIAVDLSPEQVGPRAGPRGSAGRATKRDLRAGRIEPSDRDAYGPSGETDCP